jgi:hypothetical protein
MFVGFRRFSVHFFEPRLAGVASLDLMGLAESADPFLEAAGVPRTTLTLPYTCSCVHSHPLSASRRKISIPTSTTLQRAPAIDLLSLMECGSPRVPRCYQNNNRARMASSEHRAALGASHTATCRANSRRLVTWL